MEVPETAMSSIQPLQLDKGAAVHSPVIAVYKFSIDIFFNLSVKPIARNGIGQYPRFMDGGKCRDPIAGQ